MGSAVPAGALRTTLDPLPESAPDRLAATVKSTEAPAVWSGTVESGSVDWYSTPLRRVKATSTPGSVTWSVVSVAVRATTWAVVSATVKVAFPLTPVMMVDGVRPAWPVAARVTVRSAAGFPQASTRDTVTVVVFAPSAGTDGAATATTDRVAEAGPAATVTAGSTGTGSAEVATDSQVGPATVGLVAPETVTTAGSASPTVECPSVTVALSAVVPPPPRP